MLRCWNGTPSGVEQNVYSDFCNHVLFRAIFLGGTRFSDRYEQTI